MATNLPAELKAILDTPEWPELGPGPRPGVQPVEFLEEQMGPFLKSSGLKGPASDLIRATVLLWHDHLEPAHGIAQAIETPDGSYVHGIVHRREPDYGNSKYWFRRAGDHPCFQPLAKEAENILRKSAAAGWKEKLAPRGQWDPFAFIDACEKVASLPETVSPSKALREIQAMEFELLLACLLGE